MITNADSPAIYKTADNLRELMFKNDDDLTYYEKIVKSRTCDLRKLESIYMQYLSTNS
jgi:hypothetical protein